MKAWHAPVAPLVPRGSPGASGLVSRGSLSWAWGLPEPPVPLTALALILPRVITGHLPGSEEDLEGKGGTVMRWKRRR